MHNIEPDVTMNKKAMLFCLFNPDSPLDLIVNCNALT